MFKIGDFSNLSRVSVKALRLYDQMGLLKPAHVDYFTGYRYYSAEQLPHLNRLLAFKDLGFSLEQIGQLLNDQISLSQMRGMLRLKQAELQQIVEAQETKLARIEARLKQIELEDTMPNYEVVLKKVNPYKVISIRETLANYPSIRQLFNELENYRHLHQEVKPASYYASIWYDPGYKEQDVDGEAVIAIEQALSGNERIKVYELPSVEMMACVIHHGTYKTLNLAYIAICNWIDANGYKIVGYFREFYIERGQEKDEPSNVTEVQIPVAKV